MIVPSTSFVALSLLTLTTALPFAPSSSSPSQSTELDLDISTGSWRYPSFLPSSVGKRSVELDLGEGEEGGIVVLNTNAVDDGSLTDDSSFRDDDDTASNDTEEDVFDPSSSSDNKVIKNPKVIPNPKSPKFSDTTSAAPTTSTTTTSATPAATSATTFKGEATYFYQGGVAGACGKVNPDSAYIVALDYRLYGDLGKVSKYCGKSLTIKNTANGKTVQATVADACPSCSSVYSLDLSEAAFGAIGEYDTGILPIQWWWN